MVPTIYNFGNHYKGNNLETTKFIIKSVDTKEPVNLTDTTILCQFCRNFSKTIVASFTVDNGLTVTDPLLGAVEIDAFNVDFEVGGYDYDIMFTYPDGAVQTHIAGIINIITK